MGKVWWLPCLVQNPPRTAGGTFVSHTLGPWDRMAFAKGARGQRGEGTLGVDFWGTTFSLRGDPRLGQILSPCFVRQDRAPSLDKMWE